MRGDPIVRLTGPACSEPCFKFVKALVWRKKSLRRVAAQLHDDGRLFCCFHTFADDIHAKIRSQANDIAKHYLRPLPRQVALDEAAIDLEAVRVVCTMPRDE